MFKALTLQARNNLSNEHTEFYLRDRLTWMHFPGLGLGDPVPDASTIWTFCEVLTEAGAVERRFELFDGSFAPRAISPCPGSLAPQSTRVDGLA
jgi:IS5 family transposase